MGNRKKTVWYRNKRLRSAGVLSLVLMIGSIGFVIILKSMMHQMSIEEAAKSLWKHKKQIQESMNGNIEDMLLEKNKYSRPGVQLKEVHAVVIHYTANPGTSARANRNYFNRLPELNLHRKNPIYASSHYIIGLEGEIIRCIPETEISYASNDRNSDTLSIECCHPKKNGRFTKKTYDSLVWLTAQICKTYKIEAVDIIRHYDITQKKCPKYFVENEDAWTQFKKDVMEKTRS